MQIRQNMKFNAENACLQMEWYKHLNLNLKCQKFSMQEKANQH